MAEKTSEEVRAWVSDYYGKILKASKDLKTNACCASGKPPKWLQRPLSNVHSEVMDKFYGCGYPFPEGVESCQVLDLVSCDTYRCPLSNDICFRDVAQVEMSMSSANSWVKKVMFMAWI